MAITMTAAPTPIALAPNSDDPLAGVSRDDAIDIPERDIIEFDGEEYDITDWSDEHLEEFTNELETEINKPYVPPAPPAITDFPLNSEPPEMTSKERAQLAHNIENMPVDEFLNDPLTRAVRQYAPDELSRYLIPESFPGMQDASWQMNNSTRMQIHSRAKMALSQAPSPMDDQQ